MYKVSEPIRYILERDIWSTHNIDMQNIDLAQLMFVSALQWIGDGGASKSFKILFKIYFLYPHKYLNDSLTPPTPTPGEGDD